MRIAFVKSLIKLAKRDERIFLLTGDLGYGVLEGFQEAFPDRFLNVGVAEANMVGVAAGLALSEKTPYIYSISTFLVMRALEQIRNDICYQNLNVKIVGVGSGLTYSLYGATHQPIDDLGVIRALPNMVILSPGDPLETAAAVDFSLKYQGPVYLRLAGKGEPKIHGSRPLLKLGQGINLKQGKDITLMATGSLLANAFLASEQLIKKGISVCLISMPFVKPIDKKIILKAARETKAIFTLEEHSLIGGLGTAAAEVLAEANIPKVLFKRIALPDQYPPEIGSRAYLREKYGLSVDGIVKKILDLYKK